MDSNLRKSIDELHRHIISCAHDTINRVAQFNGVEHSTSNILMLDATQLLRLLPEVSKPVWLVKLVELFQGKILASNIGGNCSGKFANFLISNMSKIECPILAPDEVLYNFDHTFDEVRETEGIPNAFDSLVARLEEIIAADLIDSRVVQEALERLMALLKRNKHGSLTSILVSMHYGRFALKAFGGVLAANKYLKPMVDSFKEEFEIAEEKVRKAEESLKREAICRLVNQERLTLFIEGSNGDTKYIAGYLGQQESVPTPTE